MLKGREGGYNLRRELNFKKTESKNHIEKDVHVKG